MTGIRTDRDRRRLWGLRAARLFDGQVLHSGYPLVLVEGSRVVGMDVSGARLSSSLPVTGTSGPLHEPSNALWRADLNHTLHGRKVDAEIERRCAHDQPYRPALDAPFHTLVNDGTYFGSSPAVGSRLQKTPAFVPVFKSTPSPVFV